MSINFIKMLLSITCLSNRSYHHKPVLEHTNDILLKTSTSRDKKKRNFAIKRTFVMQDKPQFKHEVCHLRLNISSIMSLSISKTVS